MPTTINPSDQTITQYNIQTGGASNLLNNVAPSATSGVPVISQGAASQPVFGTAVVAGGGTGQVTLTNHGVLVGAATSAITQLAAGSAGQILQSGGATADPAYSTATYPSTAGTSGKVLISDGTNIVSSTPTFPNTSATSGKFIRSDGTNWIASTPTLPTSAGTSGKVLQSDGTNYVESTPTYPSTSGSAGKILRSDGTNNLYTTATFPDTAGTSGNVLTSDGTNWSSSASQSFGQSISSTASAVSLSSPTAKTVTSIGVTAGTWDISAICSNVGSTNALTQSQASISTTDNTLTGAVGDTQSVERVATAIFTASHSIPVVRVTVASGTTTYYLVAQATFGSGTCTGNGRISAVKVS